ncbi:MAG TPA: right-handed parallel beta-helix repeat-containing protein, partial [Candidatus Limnocylindrales bacterium]|nr:right-handed parallel beta-helix repeat-containing protein [Candidatus Limnocylindrales bacterium]
MSQTRLHANHVRAVAVLIITAIAFAVFVPVASVHAASISVPCDSAALFAALITAGSNSQADTITLSAGCTYQTTLVLPIQPDGGALTTIEGSGATIQMIGSQGVLELCENTNATINNLTLTDGDNPFQGGAIFTDVGSTLILTNSTLSNSSANQGGGIYVRGVSATLTNVTISGSSATLGGGVFVENGTAMTIANSVISSNAATDDGGGLFVKGTAALSLINTAVSGNTATNDGGGLENFGQSTISASTFSANTAITGAGIHNGSQATMTNTTLSGNIALGSGGGIFSDAASTFYNSTFSANSAASGGNIYRKTGAFTMVNSIAANNAGGGDCAGASPTVGNTLVEDGSCGVTSGSGGNLTGDPNLGPLANNGGATLTHALLTGSIAGNAGDNSNVPGGVTTDQTGAARIQGGTVDMGSVEGAGGGTSLVTISPAAASVLEGGTASLTVSRTSSTIDPMIVTFSTGGSAPGADFSAGTQVTIPGGSASANLDVVTTSNAVDDGDRTVVVMLADGAAYDLGANITSTVTITDDDTAGVTVTPTSGLITTEAGGTDTFMVVLLSQPTADVSIAVASSDTSEGTAAPTPLTFTSANWNVAQTVTVTGVNDDVDDGNAAYSVTLSATSADGNYNAIVLPSVSVTNTDDDSAGVTVTPTSGLITTEAGGTDTFTVVLLSQPTADVSIAVASSDTTEGTAAPTPLTFTSANWNVAQTVTVTGVDDALADGSIVFVVNMTAASADAAYNGISVPSVSVTNQDDDAAGVTVSPSSGLFTTEAGGTAQFNVMLNSEPTADVTIAVASSDTAEGTAAPTPLTFTSANWNVAQSVTVTGVDDFVDDGDIAYTVTLGISSADTTYGAMSLPGVGITNMDDDTTGMTVTPTSGLVTTEAGGTAPFTVVLTSQPLGDVTVSVDSNNTAEGTAAPTPLTFTAANWNVAQTVTVTGADDLVADGNVAYTVGVVPASAADSLYDGLPAQQVNL